MGTPWEPRPLRSRVPRLGSSEASLGALCVVVSLAGGVLVSGAVEVEESGAEDVAGRSAPWQGGGAAADDEEHSARAQVLR